MNNEGDLFLTLDSLVELNNIISGKKNNGLRVINVKPAGYNCMYMHYNNINFALQILINNYNNRRITKTEFLKRFLEIYPFEDCNGRMVKILFVQMKLKYEFRKKGDFPNKKIDFCPDNELIYLSPVWAEIKKWFSKSY